VAMALPTVLFGAWLWEVDFLCRTLFGRFILSDSQVLAGYADFRL